MTTKILIAIAVVAMLAVFFTMRQAKDYEKFLETAKATYGQLLEKEERIAEPKNKRMEYWITYSFTDPSDATHNMQMSVEYQDWWQNLREGQSLEVYYDPVRPSENYPVELVNRRMGMAGKTPKKR